MTESSSPPPTASAPLTRRAFVAASFLSLFLEVLLIRWCGAEIRILAYLKNLTLLACFLGLGLGYAASARRRLGLEATFAAVTGIFVFTNPELLGLRDVPSFRELSRLLNFSDLNSWKTGGGGGFELGLGLGLLGFLYAVLAFAFVPIGQALGAHFRAVPAERRVAEYTWNVAASLLGVAAFGALSFLEAPPLAWVAVAGVSGVLAAPIGRGRVLAAALVSLGALALAERLPPRLEGDVAEVPKIASRVLATRWSPYQKIQLVEESYAFDRPASVALVRSDAPARLEWQDRSNYVNGHWYSRVGNVDLDVAKLRAEYAKNPSPHANQLLLRLPYWCATGRKRALLLGAGMGRDAATALAEGFEQVDCVEIERSFVEWGKELHPQEPYRKKNVTVHVDDARRFLRSADRASYDIVVFCYLDAHGLTSNFTNTNLDSYVYTKESFHEASLLLAPGGVLAVGFWSPRPFIYRRLERLLTEEFGGPPVRFADGSLFVTAAGRAELARLRGRVKSDRERLLPAVVPAASFEDADTPPATEDDWPFFYVEKKEVPKLYLVVLGAIALVSAGGVRVAVGPLRRVDMHFLLLGAAFMLVETWAISRASLVYGATWYVSSAVIASLLVAILAANAYVEKKGEARLARAFPLLLVFLLVATLVDPSRFLELPRAAQLALAAPLYAVPFLFASAIFASSFARAERPEEALASNLLGSVLGGALECLSFAIGLRALGFIALGLYALAWAAARRR